MVYDISTSIKRGHKMALRLDQELSKDERAAIMADIEEEKQKKLQVPGWAVRENMWVWT